MAKKKIDYPDYSQPAVDDYPDYSQPTNRVGDFSNVPQDQGMIGKLANSAPVNFILGGGDALRNMLSAGTLAKQNSGSGSFYDAGKLSGDIGGFLGGGEVLDGLRFMGEGAPLIGKALKSLGGEKIIPSVARRVGGSTAYGAAESPDDRTGGAEMGAVGGTIGEALPVGLKTLGNISELINPKKYASKLGDMFAKDYARARAKAGALYDSVKNKYGNSDIYQQKNILLPGQQNAAQQASNNYMSLDQDIINKYFTPKVKKLHEYFMDNPNFQNAHLLQSQLGSESARLGRGATDALTNSTKQSMDYARSLLKGDMQRFLSSTDKNAANTWQQADDIFKTEAAPYRSTTTVLKMANGKKKTITPLQAKNALTNAVEGGEIPDNHYISKALNDLTNKVERGKAISSAIPPLVKSLSPMPGFIEMAGNPYMQKLGNNISPYYQALKNSIIAARLKG